MCVTEVETPHFYLNLQIQYSKIKLDKEELSLHTIRNLSLCTACQLMTLSYSLIMVELCWTGGACPPSTYFIKTTYMVNLASRVCCVILVTTILGDYYKRDVPMPLAREAASSLQPSCTSSCTSSSLASSSWKGTTYTTRVVTHGELPAWRGPHRRQACVRVGCHAGRAAYHVV
jgi:hypothetical protein